MNRFYALGALGLSLAFSGPASAQSAEYAPASELSVAQPAFTPPSLGDASRMILLYSNGPIQTGTGNGAGGANTSAIGAYGSTLFGSGHNAAASVNVADDFTVPAGSSWTIESMDFFAYQTGGNATSSSFTGVFVQIWDGRPGDPGSEIIAGDITDNVLETSEFTGIYRVTSAALTGNTRPIYRLRAIVEETLQPGTYWVQWGATGSIASGPWVPPVTTTEATPPPGNARQLINGAWQDALDGAAPNQFPLDFPFLINGTATVSSEGGPALARGTLAAAPNPVRGAASVRLAVEQSQDVSVVVYDALGRAVATLFEGTVAEGHPLRLRLDGASLPSGVYAVRATGTSLDLVHRVTVVP